MSLIPPGDRRGEPVRAFEWEGGENGALRFLDQTRLPAEAIELVARSAEQVHTAIRRLAIRGAPAIGLAAAYGLVLGMREHDRRPAKEFLEELAEIAAYLSACRPTAVNLAHAIDASLARVSKRAARGGDASALLTELLASARAMHEEDARCCRAMGLAGAALLEDGMAVLTHCNTGALATGGTGTALAVVYAATAAGKRLRVFANETRPLLQGARLTAWELSRAGIDVTLLVDGAAASLLHTGRIDAVFVGADRIAANGDVANKIGTLGVALAANEFGVPFYVVAPSSTCDLETPSGAEIPIEERSAAEVATLCGQVIAADGASVWNPAFDVTPARWLTGLITEQGVLLHPTAETLRAHLGADLVRLSAP